MPSLPRLTVLTLFAAAMVGASNNVIPMRRRHANPSAIPVTATEYGTIFDVEVKLGNQSFLLLFDTGSSDTWVVQTGFECIDADDGTILSQGDCDYASTYDISPTFKKIENEHFGVEYGDGIATGIIGHEDVTLGGITVKNQQIGVVNYTTNPGDGLDSGILGFGYPALTSAHPGTIATNGSQFENRIIYNPLFTNMYQQNLVAPYFSIALERTPQNASVAPAGYLALGSLPPVPHSAHFSIAPVEITETIPLSYTNGTAKITEWTLSVSSTVFGNSDNVSQINTTKFQAVVDAGQPLNVLPSALAHDINAQFSPPAIYNDTLDAFLVDCDASPPTLGFEIGDQIFWHNGKDLIIGLGDGRCVSAIAATVPVEGLVLNFLGDAFLKNVVAVFDFGVDEMRFAARTEY